MCEMRSLRTWCTPLLVECDIRHKSCQSKPGLHAPFVALTHCAVCVCVVLFVRMCDRDDDLVDGWSDDETQDCAPAAAAAQAAVPPRATSLPTADDVRRQGQFARYQDSVVWYAWVYPTRPMLYGSHHLWMWSLWWCPGAVAIVADTTVADLLLHR